MAGFATMTTAAKQLKEGISESNAKFLLLTEDIEDYNGDVS